MNFGIRAAKRIQPDRFLVMLCCVFQTPKLTRPSIWQGKLTEWRNPI